MIPVSPYDLPKHWEFVEAGLKEIIRRTKESWTPTHVKNSLNKGWAQLYLSTDGFLILQRREDDWSGDVYVHVWAAWFKPGTGKARQRELVARVDEISKTVSPHPWQFRSPRKGWKALEGFEIAGIIWRRKT